MKEIYYTYNNEAIASCIFLAVFNKLATLDVARSCLILPFLLDDRTVKYLSENQNGELTLEQILKDKPLLFTSFNKRYLSLLPVTLNSLMILYKSNQINIGKKIDTLRKMPIILPYNSMLGERFDKIINVLPTFLSIINNYSTIQLYKLLKVQL